MKGRGDMKSVTVGINVATLSRRDLLRGGTATAGAMLLPWSRVLAKTRVNFGWSNEVDIVRR